MRILITASGGGHTGYAVSLAQRLHGKADLVFIIPESDTWSKAKVERYGKVIEVPKPRGPYDSMTKLILRLPKALVKSLGSVSRKFDIFISSGSNHSLFPALIAWLKGIPIYNIESCVRFTKPSRTASILRPFSYRTVLQWDEQKRFHPSGVVYGPLYEIPEYEIRDRGYILVTGGTYGHKLLYDVVSQLELDNVVLQCGNVDPEPYRKRHPNWTVFSFDPDFGKWLAGASIVISHLGKTVIDAALTYRKPVVIVPNPELKLTAGWEDARILASKLNAVVVDEITPGAILRAIEEARHRRPPTHPDGAKILADEILSCSPH
jgi:UDP-N-acetylglucosamine--N-acetylmuramyl-(pentapeptide) pyrophosphoryl-undecaprenol N-acetylglucosamine transferase